MLTQCNIIHITQHTHTNVWRVYTVSVILNMPFCVSLYHSHHSLKTGFSAITRTRGALDQALTAWQDFRHFQTELITWDICTLSSKLERCGPAYRQERIRISQLPLIWQVINLGRGDGTCVWSVCVSVCGVCVIVCDDGVKGGGGRDACTCAHV